MTSSILAKNENIPGITCIDYGEKNLLLVQLEKANYAYNEFNQKYMTKCCNLEYKWKKEIEPIQEHWIAEPNCLFIQNSTQVVEFSPRHPKFADKNKRLKSFEYWPCWQDEDDMADAGFFYTRFRDRVICYFCDITLGSWNEYDHPTYEHLKWSPNCPYLLYNYDKWFDEISIII